MNEVAGLNWLRGIAAVLVMLSHGRSFFFVDYPDLAQPVGMWMQVFYLLTGLGTGSVMIFFVLSGYLVAGSADQAIRTGRFGWTAYIVARISRLYSALLPALVLTLLFDLVGRHLFGGAFYLGQPKVDISSAPVGSADLSPLTLLGNLAFVQTIAVPVFGSNGPLWSIANEFWYYILFPLFALGLAPGAGRSRAGLLLAMLVIALIGRDIAILFPVWLMGWAVHRLRDRRLFRLIAENGMLAAVAVATLLIVLLGTRVLGLQSTLIGQYAIGLVTAFAIPALYHRAFERTSRLAHGLASSSYSLYVVHFPALAVFFAAIGGVRADTFGAGLPWFLLAITFACASAALVYLTGERHYHRIRGVLLNHLDRTHRRST